MISGIDKKKIVIAVLCLLFFDFLLFFSNFLPVFFLHSGLAACLALGIFIVKSGRQFLSSSERVYIYFLLIILLGVAIIYDSSIIYKKSVIRNWEESSKLSLTDVTTEIQDRFSALQGDMERRAKGLEDVFQKLSSSFVENDKEGINSRLLSFLDQKSEIYMPDSFLYGVSIYDKDGNLLAWWGADDGEGLPKIEPFEARDSFFYSTGDEVRTFLNRIRIFKSSSYDNVYIIVRRLLRSDFRIHNRFFSDYDFFRDISDFKLTATLIPYEDKEAQAQWENLFYRNRDFYWGQSGEDTKTLTVPLRNLSLEIIGYVSITSPTLGEKINRISNNIFFLCASLLLFSLAILTILYIIKNNDTFVTSSQKRSGKDRAEKIIVSICLIWSLRFAFLLLGYPSRFTDGNLFKPTYLALDIFHIRNSLLDELFNLFVSPFDFFLTEVAIIATLLLIFNEFRKFRSAGLKESEFIANPPAKAKAGISVLRITSSVIGTIAAAVLIILTLKINHSFIWAFFENVRVDVLWSSFIDFNFAKFLIQLSMIGSSVAFALGILIIDYVIYRQVCIILSGRISFFIVLMIDLGAGIFTSSSGIVPYLTPFCALSAFIAPLVFLFLILRNLEKPPRRSFLILVAKPFIVIFLSVLSLSPIYFRVFQQQQEYFVEKSLVNRLSEQKEWNTIIMKNTLEQFARDRRLLTKLKNLDALNSETLAYSLWSRLDPTLKGYNASLEVRDKDGNLVDRFSINPLFKNQDLAPSQREPRVLLTTKWLLYDNRNIEILVGRAICRDGDKAVAEILLCYAFDYNYIFLPAVRNPYYELFRAGDETLSTELIFSRNLFFQIYNKEGNYRSGSEEFSIPFTNEDINTLKDLQNTRWLEISSGERDYKVYAFRQGDDIFLLGFPQASFKDILFYISEVFGICFFIAVILVLLYGIFKLYPPTFSIRDLFGLKIYFKRSYVRLLITFIILSIIPIIFLSLFAYQHLSGMMGQEVEKRGVNALRIVKRYIDLNTLYGRTRDEENISALITDPLVSDIGRWINRDLNIYLGRELIATNKEELYFSHLLQPILNSHLYENLVFKKELYTNLEERIGDLSYLVVGSFIETEDAQIPLVITIPLMTEQNRIREELSDFLRLIIFLVIILINIFFFLSHWLAARFSRPIGKLTESAELIAAGDYKVQLIIERKDEIGSLIKSFNEMSRSLQKQREELFKKTHDLEGILKYASTGVISFTPLQAILTINPAALRMLRLKGKTDEYSGVKIESLFELNPAFAGLKSALDGYMKNVKSSVSSDLRISFKEGETESEVVANLIITPMWDENHKLYASLMIIEDVTEIIRSKRLEAWAEMARIIAHEIKNPLTPIQLAAQHLQVVIKDRAANLDEISNECITTILNKVSELKQFSDDFWHYSELPKLNIEPVNIGECIEEVVSPYAIAPPEGVKIKVEKPAKSPVVMVDKKLMKQTFINLIENSFHAMSEGGQLTIRVDYSKEKKKKGVVEINVIDSGMGIKAEDMPYIFEPYFSTKEKGVGLGLAIAKKTIEEHRGSINVESEKGKGTTVKVVLRVH